MFPLLLTIVRFFRSLFSGLKDEEFRGLFFFVLGLLLTGMVFYHGIENWRWLDSFYFTVTTLSTVGFGDLAPKTDLGKIFTVMYIFIGIGTIFAFITAVAHHSQQNDRIRRDCKKLKKENFSSEK